MIETASPVLTQTAIGEDEIFLLETKTRSHTRTQLSQQVAIGIWHNLIRKGCGHGVASEENTKNQETCTTPCSESD
jgi:hypothetical protein